MVEGVLLQPTFKEFMESHFQRQRSRFKAIIEKY